MEWSATSCAPGGELCEPMQGGSNIQMQIIVNLLASTLDPPAIFKLTSACQKTTGAC